MALRVYGADPNVGSSEPVEPVEPTPTDPSPTPTGRQSYRHVQSSPAAVWRFVHDLDFAPAGVRVTDRSDTRRTWLPDVDYDDATRTLTLTFPAPVAGDVVVS